MDGDNIIKIALLIAFVLPWLLWSIGEIVNEHTKKKHKAMTRTFYNFKL